MESNTLIYRSYYLLTKSTFWKGFASILNLTGGYYILNSSGIFSDDFDNKSIKSDWEAVSNDIKQSMHLFDDRSKTII
jgi:hypothetical protein